MEKLDFSLLPFANKAPYIKVKLYERPMLSLTEEDGELLGLYKIDGRKGWWLPATYRVIKGEYSDHIEVNEMIWAKINAQNAGQFCRWKRANELIDFLRDG